jgi:hypothetical protein
MLHPQKEQILPFCLENRGAIQILRMLTSFWFNHLFFFPSLFVKQNFDHKTNYSYAEAVSCEAMTSHETNHGRISLNLARINSLTEGGTFLDKNSKVAATAC